MLICCLRPTSFTQAWNLIEVKLLMLLFFAEVETSVDLLVHDFKDFTDDTVSLLAKNSVDIRIVNIFHDLALHERSLPIFLDVALPAGLRHIALLVEALLRKEFGCIVVGIGQEILIALSLCIIFKHIHEARTISTHLLTSRDSQENYLRKLLSLERPENATSYDDRFLSTLLLYDYHSLMLSVHS